MTEKIIEIAKAAGKIALSADSDRHTKVKEGRANFVTEYDTRVQAFLIDNLSVLIPEAHFIGEESDVLQSNAYDGYCFIIDPIDGTTNFIRGNSSYSICIGLLHNKQPVCGVVYIPAIDTVYFAEAGKGAYVSRNGSTNRISVSDNSLDGAVVAFGTAPYYEELVRKSFRLGEKLMTRAADIRRSGSAAIDICAVAEGTADLMFEYRICAWDITAASIILNEAGGKFSDFDGNGVLGKIHTPYVAGAPKAHSDFIEFYKTVEI